MFVPAFRLLMDALVAAVVKLQSKSYTQTI